MFVEALSTLFCNTSEMVCKLPPADFMSDSTKLPRPMAYNFYQKVNAIFALTLLLLLYLCHGSTHAFFGVEGTSSMDGRNVTVNGAKLDSGVEEIQWCGTDHRTLLLRTRSNRLYRSYDGGRSWNDISDLFRLSNDGNEEVVRIESISVNPIDKNIVVVFPNRTAPLVSENAARTFRRVKTQYRIHNWLFHPTRSNWALLAGVTDACYAASAKEQSGCNRVLFVTKDLGRTVELVASYVVQFSWGDKAFHQQDRVYFTQHSNQKGNQFNVGGWAKDVDFLHTDDFGKTTKVLVPSGNKFIVSNEYLFVAKVQHVGQQTVNMMVSTDGGKTFRQSKLSTDIQERSYTVLDTSEGAIMLHVNHGEEGKSDNGHIYISDANGEYFSLSLPRNIRTATGECEFDKVMSVDGVYIANYKDEEEIDAPFAEPDFDSIIIDEEDTETAIEKKRKPSAKGRTQEVVRSVITYDKGGEWYLIKAPTVDSLGDPIHCSSGECSLHLHGITTYTQYAPFYSMENALGIILSTGNVGEHLRSEEHEVNTYMSRDGGVTWYEIHKGAYIYEIGDHGGLLVMADDLRPSNKVVFSWNEGKSWYDFELTGGPVDVSNIVIEPNSSSLDFLLYGTRDGYGVVFHLDFNTLGQRICQGVNEADSLHSDFETWIPNDGRTGGCILGREMTYTRRKQLSECFHGKDFQRPKLKRVCPCAKSDYECNLGFTRHINNWECIPENPLMANAKCTSASFVLMDAYRKVPGDMCQGGWLPEKVPVLCPPHAPFSKGAKMILLILFLIAVIMWSLTFLSRSPKAKRFFGSFDLHYEPLARKEDDASIFYMDNSKYEPELGFIDAEQDEHEEDAPSLISYSAPRERNLIEMDSHFFTTQSRTTRRNVTEAIPRIPPPPGSNNLFEGDSVELL